MSLFCGMIGGLIFMWIFHADDVTPNMALLLASALGASIGAHIARCWK